MKKSTIKLIAMLLTVVLMLPSFAGAGALNENEVDDSLLTREEVEEICRQNNSAQTAYEEMMSSWQNDSGEVDYPDSYGGCYITDDHKLLIKLVNGNDILKAQIQDVVSDVSILVFEDTDISRNDLIALQDNLDEVLPNYEVTYSELDERESVIEVGVHPDSIVSALMSRSIIPSHIRIKVHGYNQTTAASATIAAPGKNIFFYTNSGGTCTATMGWYGKYNFGSSTMKDVFVSAAHFTRPARVENANILSSASPNPIVAYSADLNRSSSYFDTINTGAYGDDIGIAVGLSSPLGDFGIAEYNSGAVAPSNVIGGYTVTRSQAFVPPVGQTVIKPAGVSGYKAATVSSTSASYSADVEANGGSTEVKFEKLVKTNAPSSGSFSIDGDSGGAIIMSTSNGWSWCGIVSGRDKITRGGYFTPSSSIINLGFSPYLG